MELAIGLFDDFKHAEKAIKDLETRDFKREEIYLVGRKAEGPYAATFASHSDAGAAAAVVDIAPELEDRGVPPEDAREYGDAVRSGDYLLLVRVPEKDRAAEAAGILSKREEGGPLTEERPEGENAAPVIGEEWRVGKRGYARIYTC